MANYDWNTKSFTSGGRVWINADEFIVKFMKFTKAIDPQIDYSPQGARYHAKPGSNIKKALRKAGQYIAKISKQNLRASNKTVTGNLLKSYSVKVKGMKGGYASGVYIGFNHLGRHAHLVDQGHEVVDNRSGHEVHTGKKTKGSYFHTKAREHMPQAAAVFVATYERELLEEAQYWSTHG